MDTFFDRDLAYAAMIKHKRRPDYWVYYHLGHCTETAFLIDMITNLVRENPCPHREKSNRGRPPVHSRAKLDFICILMVAWHKTSRDMESDLSVIKRPWAGEPVPDHTTLARHLQTISQDWLDTILTKTATLCVAEAGSGTGPLGADSSCVETTRYETVTRPLKSEKNFVEMARKAYLKYHVIAILDLQIILESDHDQQHRSTMLPVMLDGMKRQGLSPGPTVFNADRGYDSDYNCGILFEMGMSQHQAENLPSTAFDKDEYVA